MTTEIALEMVRANSRQFIVKNHDKDEWRCAAGALADEVEKQKETIAAYNKLLADYEMLQEAYYCAEEEVKRLKEKHETPKDYCACGEERVNGKCRLEAEG